jgi:hypothetical protein
MTKTGRLTAKQLRNFVDDYSAIFTEWRSIGGYAFVRSDGPFRQSVGFESLLSGAYRPMNAISTTVGPEAVLHHQFLDVKHREVQPREHSRMRDRVARAMDEQFEPSIRSPLEPIKVLALCEHRAVGKIRDASGLAVANAYLGNVQRSFYWLERIRSVFESIEGEPAAWQRELVDFGKQLRDALVEGTAENFLENWPNT